MPSVLQNLRKRFLRLPGPGRRPSFRKIRYRQTHGLSRGPGSGHRNRCRVQRSLQVNGRHREPGGLPQPTERSLWPDFAIEEAPRKAFETATGTWIIQTSGSLMAVDLPGSEVLWKTQQRQPGEAKGIGGHILVPWVAPSSKVKVKDKVVLDWVDASTGKLLAQIEIGEYSGFHGPQASVSACGPGRVLVSVVSVWLE
jgi:hypothetical protein